MKKIIFLLMIVIMAISCNKADTGGCWECTDAQGNALETVCGSSEQEAFNNSGTIAGSHDINTFRQFCHKK